MPVRQRVFKTGWFGKAARRAGIGDAELCAAMRQVMAGQCDDLGGGVYKKRLGKNLYRSIVVARGGRFWVYTYLFAKQDRTNIDDEDLADLRDLARIFAQKTEVEITTDLRLGKLVEICHEDEA